MQRRTGGAGLPACFACLGVLWTGVFWTGALWAEPAPSNPPREPTNDSQPAEAEAAPSKPTLPVLLDDPGVVYPPDALRAGFTKTVRVVLVLELDAKGNVTGAKLEAPGDPRFDATALEASRKLKFRPATAGGIPRAARIRYVYVFDPPAALLSGRVVDAATGTPLQGVTLTLRGASGETTLTSDEKGEFHVADAEPGTVTLALSAPGYEAQQTTFELVPGKELRVDATLNATGGAEPKSAEPQPGQAPIEILVQGERRAPTVKSFTREEVRQLPGAFGDPFRAIEAMPGVTPVASGLPFFYVRGAPPGNVGYFLDGVRVPYLYHVALGPSVVHPGLVERVDLYAGGYPARFGRFAGGIVSAETTAPTSVSHGEANVRLFDAGALVETGFAEGRGSALVGARYSYTATLLSLVVPDLKLDYRDYQARVSYDVTPDDTLSLFGFGSYDLLAEEQGGGLNVLFGTEFYRLSLRHSRRLPRGDLTTSVTLGYDQTHLGFTSNVDTRSLDGRSELHQQLATRALLRAGLDVALDSYKTEEPAYYDPEDPGVAEFTELFPTRNDSAIGVYADVVFDVDRHIEVTPGLRFDAYRSGDSGAFAVEPRVAARFSITDSFRILHAHGIAHQPPSFVIPVPGLEPQGLEDGLQQSYQTSAGVELDLDRDTLASATAFYNTYLNMTDALGTVAPEGEDEEGSEVFQQRSLGSGVGLEVFLRRNLARKLGGFVSYTLSRSWRSVGRESFPSNFDRTHVLNLALGYGFGRGYRVGGRVVFYTGTPTQPEPVGPIQPLRSEHPERSKPFYRLDLRFEKKWMLGGRSFLSFVAEVMNTTLSKETFGDEEVGPITVPSIGVEGGF